MNKSPLALLPIPDLSLEQLSLFHKTSLNAGERFNFDPEALVKNMQKKNNQQILALELGGDKMTNCQYLVHANSLQPTENVNIFYSAKGRGYLEKLMALAKIAKEKNALVGVSFAGPVAAPQGEPVAKSQIKEAPNMPEFLEDLAKSKYPNIHALFDTKVALVNDAVATTLTAVFHTAQKNQLSQNLLLIIIGSGLGGAVWSRNLFASPAIVPLEPGHVPVTKSLNPNNQTKTCSFLNNKQVCLENIASGKAGIEDLYSKLTGQNLTGFDIAKKLLEKDQTALALYETSTTIIAHVVLGITNSLKLDLNKTIIALHGGVTLVPGYSERVENILKANSKQKINLIETKQTAKHSGILGAAIASLVNS